MTRKKSGKWKIHKVMREFKAGTLRTPSGKKVTNRNQAIAIAMSEAKMTKKKKPRKAKKR
ncbi:MAG: hypothetical protein CO041_04255 [Candidatus Pacebacteria bacterium CG_4_9_14_0_2_um_filter_40_15]|nr:MAG: hypothetical protein CO041_04255 [Candidatus Pacebacteria bacterium CG_4_9_14_0_2_um_filter_40_15]